MPPNSCPSFPSYFCLGTVNCKLGSTPPEKTRHQMQVPGMYRPEQGEVGQVRLRLGKNKLHELRGVQFFKIFSAKFVKFSTKFGYLHTQMGNKFKNIIFISCKGCQICKYYLNSMVISGSTCQREEKECT